MGISAPRAAVVLAARIVLGALPLSRALVDIQKRSRWLGKRSIATCSNLAAYSRMTAPALRSILAKSNIEMGGATTRTLIMYISTSKH